MSAPVRKHPRGANYIDRILPTKNVSANRWERKPDLRTDHAWLMADLKLSE